MRFRIDNLSAAVLATALLTLAGCENGADVAQQFDRYAKASTEHDLATLEALTADDIVWQLGPYRLEGKEEVLGPNAYDAGVENQLIYRNARVEGDVVEFELIETNEVIRAVGMTEVRYYPRYEFENGQLTRKAGAWKEPPAKYSLLELNRRKVPFHRWIRETHPEAMQELIDSEGNFVFSQDNGALILRLTREWVAAGAPGRLTNERPAGLVGRGIADPGGTEGAVRTTGAVGSGLGSVEICTPTVPQTPTNWSEHDLTGRAPRHFPKSAG